MDSFPKKFSEDVHIVFEKVIKLKRKNLVCSNESRTINVNFDSENIIIPGRIYCAEPNNAGNLSDIQRDILACIYSIHNNGFVRQKYIETLISKKEYWITPFFVQLFGEYVYEILVIFDKYLVQNMDNCVTFVNENQKYWETTKSRMINYWNEYHRTKYSNFGAYLGGIVEKINKKNLIMKSAARSVGFLSE